jgi:CPA2 family monovalent cation:H+ antiporter-2
LHTSRKKAFMEQHLPFLISDLALILVAAALTTLLFKKLKQPIVLGYIIAGVLVGPQVHVIPTVTDQASIKIWAEIGVIFLLFSLGLEFSFKKLVRVGGTASITALTEIVFIVVAGYFVGRWMGWKPIDCIFLGGMLASSSTTIIIKAFDELGIKTKKFARIVFGVLIVEDIVVILLLVLLPTIAISQQFHGSELLGTVLKLVFFLLLWFLLGIFLLPTFLKKAAGLLDPEMMLLLSIGLCLAMVVLAIAVGFTAELGAFVMGSIFAETTSSDKVEHILHSLKDLFGAVFFVSVGMMIDLHTIWEYRVPVIVITLLTIFGKFFSTSLGALLSGQPLKQSVQTGMSMAQIGEFAFIVATLGLTLGVISDFLFPVAVGVSAITTFTTPYMIRYSEPFYQWIEKILPGRWIHFLNRYSSDVQKIPTVSGWKQLLRTYGRVIILNGVISIGIILLCSIGLTPLLDSHLPPGSWKNLVLAVIALILLSPFLWALGFRPLERISFSKLWLDSKLNRGPLVLLEALRMGIVVLLIGFLLDRLFSASVAIPVAVICIILLILLFSRKLQHFYNRIEKRFLLNLNAKESQENGQKINIVPWDGHVVYFDIPAEAPFAGRTLKEMAWREKFGINVALIERGTRLLQVPGPEERIFPADRIAVIGTDAQLQSFGQLIEQARQQVPADRQESIGLMQFLVKNNSPLAGKSIRESGIRERGKGLVVGVERNGERQLNPDSSFIFQPEDLVWIAGNKDAIHSFS